MSTRLDNGCVAHAVPISRWDVVDAGYRQMTGRKRSFGVVDDSLSKGASVAEILFCHWLDDAWYDRRPPWPATRLLPYSTLAERAGAQPPAARTSFRARVLEDAHERALLCNYPCPGRGASRRSEDSAIDGWSVANGWRFRSARVTVGNVITAKLLILGRRVAEPRFSQDDHSVIRRLSMASCESPRCHGDLRVL